MQYEAHIVFINRQKSKELLHNKQCYVGLENLPENNLEVNSKNFKEKKIWKLKNLKIKTK